MGEFLPFKSSLKYFPNLGHTLFWISLVSIYAEFSILKIVSMSSADSILRKTAAAIAYPRQKRLPIRSMPQCRGVPYPHPAPTNSQRFAISFMNDILVAKNELAAYFVSSDERSSIKITGLPWRTYGEYNSAINCGRVRCRAHNHPVGFHKILTGTSLSKNSGFKQPQLLNIGYTVVNCTVDFVTITLYSVISPAISLAAPST